MRDLEFSWDLTWGSRSNERPLIVVGAPVLLGLGWVCVFGCVPFFERESPILGGNFQK